MEKNVFEFSGRRIELWTHPEPDHLGILIRRDRTFYELDVLMKCREIYLPGTVIVDVGANIGNHSIFFSLILNAPVYAFEPYEPTYELLELNIAANHLDRQIIAASCAIGEADGVGSVLAGPPANLGTARVCFGAGDTMVRSLDSLAIPGRMGLMKVDVEGGELAVLRGAEGLIRAWLPDIVVEAGRLADFWRIADVLSGFGYVPRGRYAVTATYLFSAADQTARMRRLRETA